MLLLFNLILVAIYGVNLLYKARILILVKVYLRVHGCASIAHLVVQVRSSASSSASHMSNHLTTLNAIACLYEYLR